MTIDRLAHAQHYFGLGTGVQRALEYLQHADLGHLATGRHDIDGTDVFALISDYETKPEAEGRWEAHRRYIDVQYVHSGEEQVGYADLASLAAGPYDREKDILFAEGAGGQFAALTSGSFVILFPHDVHMPGVVLREPTRVRKVVIKVSTALAR